MENLFGIDAKFQLDPGREEDLGQWQKRFPSKIGKILVRKNNFSALVVIKYSKQKKD